MRFKMIGLALCASLLSLSVPGAASAATSEPLNQYVVSGGITTDQLARAGFDLSESGSSKGQLGIVATAAQAKALRAKGATVVASGRETRSLLRVAPTGPLTAPTYGYDVYRPWSLEPAPCPDTCSTPLMPLKDWYHSMAVKYPQVVKEEVIGRSVLGQAIMAYKVSTFAKALPDGIKPVTLFESTQHAREWISAETNRRLFEYVITHRLEGKLPKILRENELWFMPMMNPDGYDYTFTSKANRLWRKNLRDVNGDGVIDSAHDGVDLNRNWPEKWDYDLEGSSADPSSETYHGTGPASEPEVLAARRLQKRLRPRFLIDYHSYGPLILYPEGWQVETEATDGPIMKALAGTNQKPAIEGYSPEVAAQLYTTNGDVTGDAYNAWGSQAYTVEIDGGSGDPVGGTVETPTGQGMDPDGFVFQDSEADVQAEFEKNLPFALDLAQSTGRPDAAKSHLGNTVPDFVPTTFTTSNGGAQTVQVNAKRSLGRVVAYWRINGGPAQRAFTTQWDGGEKYGKPGKYFHKLRAQVTGAKAGDSVSVWFESSANLLGPAKRSTPFSYTVETVAPAKVLLLVSEDYTGRTAADPAGSEPYAGPLYQATYEAALKAAGVPYDVYDVDAAGRTAASALGVLSHYKAVIWETGDDIYPREPGQPNGTGASKLADDELIGMRDYLNEGGKVLVAGRYALQVGWDQVNYNPDGAPAGPYCDGSPEAPVDCTLISNDFQQYWLGAYQQILAPTDGATPLAFAGSGGVFGTTPFTINGADSAANQEQIYSFLTTSSILPVAAYPQFASKQAVKLDRLPAFDPPTGTHYAFSQATDDSYKRLSRTVDLTGKAAADLSFKVSFDTEPEWDFVFVEAHTVGQDDWTTLPDANGHTSDDVGDSCPQIPTTDEHPFLTHYLTFVPAPTKDDDPSCDPTGTTGTWNAATGNSGGQQEWSVDLSAYAGKQVELSITYSSDEGVQGLGVFVDDTKITADGATLVDTSFEDGLGGWAVPGAPEGSTGNANDWISSTSVGYLDGPGVATDQSIYWGFGLEGVTGADTRAKVLRDALQYLGATG